MPEPPGPEPEADQPAALPETAPLSSAGAGRFEWQAFSVFLEEGYKGPAPSRHLLSGARSVSFQSGLLVLELPSQAQLQALEREKDLLEEALAYYLGQPVRVELALSEEAQHRRPAAQDLPPADRPELKHCFEILKAHVMAIVPKSSITQAKPKRRRGRPAQS